MSAASSIKVDTSRLKKIQGELDPRAEKLIRKVTFDVEGEAKKRANVDTGAMRAGIYAAVSGHSNYSSAKSKAMSEAKKRAKKVARKRLRKVGFTGKVDESTLSYSVPIQDEIKPNRLEGIVHAPLEYSIHQEFGTTKMRAHPFLIPALEKIKSAFLDAWKELIQ